MAPVTIHVRGNADIPLRAERAILDVEIRSEASEQKQAAQDVASSSRQLQTLLRTLSPPSGSTSPTTPLSKWSMDSFTTTSFLPSEYNRESSQSPQRVFATSVAFKLEVQDFGKLGELVTQLSTSIHHARVHDVRWELTEDTKKYHQSELRRLAAADALQKATDYAYALGLQTVRIVELREEGAGGGAVYYASARNMVRGFENGHADEEKVFQDLEFVPEDIKLTCAVDCRFEAD